MKKLLLITLVSHLTLALALGSEITGYWLGEMNIGNSTLKIGFSFEQNKNGQLTATMDSPDQGAYGIPTSGIIFNNNELIVEVAKIKGEYKGEMSEDGLNIKGIWTQGGHSLPLNITRLSSKPELKRPQNPQKPFPYKIKDVSFKNEIDHVTLAGTLTYPKGKGPFPAILLVTGSGPQDRDETILAHKPFWIIADYLTRQGYAVLRFDDRGTGKSTGSFISADIFDLVKDAESGVKYLKSQKKINPQKIGVLGHSEGGIIAGEIAANDPGLGFIILLASPGVSGYETICDQVEALSRQMGMPEDSIKMNIELEKRLLDVVISDMSKKEMIQRMKEILPDKEKQKSLGLMVSDHYINLMKYDARKVLEKAKCPVLALNGEKDVQVLADKNLSAIETALKSGGNEKVKTVKFTDLNHLFQHADSGLPTEYGDIEETIAPEVLETILKWLDEIIK